MSAVAAICLSACVLSEALALILGPSEGREALNPQGWHRLPDNHADTARKIGVNDRAVLVRCYQSLYVDISAIIYAETPSCPLSQSATSPKRRIGH